MCAARSNVIISLQLFPFVRPGMRVRWCVRLNRLPRQLIALTHMGPPVCDVIGHQVDRS